MKTQININLDGLQLRIEDYGFFPTNRALSLTNTEEDETDAKLDDLAENINLLVQKQKQQVQHTEITSRLRSKHICSED